MLGEKNSPRGGNIVSKSRNANALARAQLASASKGRACRLRVQVLAIKDLKRRLKTGAEALAPPSGLRVSVAVEQKKRVSKEAKQPVGPDGIIAIGQSFKFDVRDPKVAELRVKAYSNHWAFGRKFWGMVRIPVQELLDQARIAGKLREADEPKWYDFYTRDGRKHTSGHALLRLSAATAEPEQKISAFIGTWNVGNAPPPADLTPWLPANKKHEIIAVGAQECGYEPRGVYKDCGEDWVGTLRAHFGESYKLVQASFRGQMRLVVFVREDMEAAITEVCSTSEATGVGHVLANKGGISISFKFWDTAVCFTSCHFAAHAGQCETRNRNYKEIVAQSRLGSEATDILSQFHHVFWMGDLNYRLDFRKTAASGHAVSLPSSPRTLQGGSQPGSPLALRPSGSQPTSPTTSSQKGSQPGTPTSNPPSSPSLAKRQELEHREEVLQKIADKSYEDLLQHDELGREMREGRVLYGFQEGAISFAPTFKMERNVEGEYNPQRLPAWCDRVLWRSLPGCNASLASYKSFPNISTSDHKPVGAEFTLVTFALPLETDEYEEVGGKEFDDRWFIQLSALKATGLRPADSNGLSDPYIVFYGTNLMIEEHSKVVEKTLSPEWDPKELPALVLTACSLERIRREYLLVKVLDKDLASSDDTLGYAAVPLEAMVDAYSQLGSASFQVELMYKGLLNGTLEGTAELVFGPCDTRRRKSPGGDMWQRAGTLRRSFRNMLLAKSIVDD